MCPEQDFHVVWCSSQCAEIRPDSPSGVTTALPRDPLIAVLRPVRSEVEVAVERDQLDRDSRAAIARIGSAVTHCGPLAHRMLFHVLAPRR